MNKAAFSFSIFALLFCVFPTSAFSQEPVTKLPSKESQPSKQTSKLDWKNLSPLQQAVLASLESDWSTFSQSRKIKWLKVANRYPTMSAADQERLQGRMSEWSKLPQKDRRMARDNYLSSMQFPPEQKMAAWESYQQLSDYWHCFWDGNTKLANLFLSLWGASSLLHLVLAPQWANSCNANVAHTTHHRGWLSSRKKTGFLALCLWFTLDSALLSYSCCLSITRMANHWRIVRSVSLFMATNHLHRSQKSPRVARPNSRNKVS